MGRHLHGHNAVTHLLVFVRSSVIVRRVLAHFGLRHSL